MVLEEILIANGIGVMLLLILMTCRYSARRGRSTSDRFFVAIILIALAGCILEPICFLIDGRSGMLFRVLNILCNTLLYSCVATIGYLWIWYIDLALNNNRRKATKVYTPLTALFILLILLLLGNSFGGGFLFSVDENNVYSREPLGYIFYIYLLGDYLISLILYYRFRAKHGQAQFFPIWMFLAPLFLSCFVQIMFYGLSVVWVGAAIGMVGINLNLQSKQVFVDSLTGIYNRAYIEHKLIVARQKRAKYIQSGIMLDIDRFKKINDTFGHSVGDRALKNAAAILLRATDRDSLVFRFAGDEFIVLLQVPINQRDELEALTVELEQRIRAEAEQFNNENGREHYQIVFSMGHAIFNPELADDEFFHDMDVEMYKAKQQHKTLQR